MISANRFALLLLHVSIFICAVSVRAAPIYNSFSNSDLLPASQPCNSPVSNCPRPISTLSAATYVSYRKDAFDPHLKEPIAPPTQGGRIQFLSQMRFQGVSEMDIGNVYINNELANVTVGAPVSAVVDWYRAEVQPSSNVLFLSLHSNRTDIFDGGKSVDFKIEHINGSILVEDTVENLAPAEFLVTYITTTNGGRTVIGHVKNSGNSPVTIKTVLVNGQDVTSQICLPSDKQVAAGASLWWSVDMCDTVASGDVVSVVTLTQEGPVAVGAIRAVREVFPIGAWPKSYDCALPGMGGGDAWKAANKEGLTMLYANHGMGKNCGGDGDAESTIDIINQQSLSWKNFGVMIETKDAVDPSLNVTANVWAAMMADEDDAGHLDSGIQNKLSESVSIRRANPAIPSFQGGATERRDGVFAGIADIQSVDAYSAACAPHYINFFDKIPLTLPLGYIDNTRLNNMPMPTWPYSQFLDDMWPEVPRSVALEAQIAYTVAGGGKGLMLFQSGIKQAMEGKHKSAETWKNTGRLFHSIAAVKEVLRTGEVFSVPAALTDGSDSKVIARAIAGPEGIVVIVINDHEWGYNGQVCYIHLADFWHMSKTKKASTVRITIPTTVGVQEAFEVVDGDMKAFSDVSVDSSSRSLKIRDISFEDGEVVKMYFLQFTP